MIIAETERLIIRVLNLEDANMYLALLNDPGFLKYIGDKEVRNLSDSIEHLKSNPLKMQKEKGYSLYCCQLKNSNKTIGISGLTRREGLEHPEVGFAFLEKYCRQGFGLESVAAVIGYARTTLKLKVLQAITDQENEASIGLLKRLGFEFKCLVKLPINDEEINLFERKLIF